MNEPKKVEKNYTDEIFKQYQHVILENEKLRKENEELKKQIERFNSKRLENDEMHVTQSLINNASNVLKPIEKIKLFMNLFRGREDVYAIRWENKKGQSGYSPVCLNEWKSGLCNKPRIKCSQCSNKSYAKLDERVIESHLTGKNIIGIYPLCVDESCHFIAIDFDEDGWQEDIYTLRNICSDKNIQIAIERSRSGNGAHAWFFFENPVQASLARKFGTALLTYAMTKRHNIAFKSYDRLFPNQDIMPKGGFGNLISLPLQKTARINDNTMFIDENFQSYYDQWNFLSNIKKMRVDELKHFISILCKGNELGLLRKDDEQEESVTEIEKVELNKMDFSLPIKIIKSNMICINKIGISQKGLNHLKRIAAFKNPEFYKAEVLRLPTFDKPRVISCSEETPDYLCLPRGCEKEVNDLLDKLNAEFEILDKTNPGHFIDVRFAGELRDEQPLAMNNLLRYDNGVLCGTTAFGKTVVAIRLIAERKVNTLILVDKVNLVTQWKNRIKEFLIINEIVQNKKTENNRKRRKSEDLIGQFGGGKDNLHGIIDIALMQSLYRKGEIKDCIKNYGMIIVDECHHISAFSFEQVLKHATAKYVYGLTATPTRKDGHHPIIFMQCGGIRYRDNPRKQADKRPFDHFVIPRFTDFRVSIEKKDDEVSIIEIYREIIESEMRNNLIIDDVIKSSEAGKNCIVLTERTTHVEYISSKLKEKIPDVISLTGGMKMKDTGRILGQISEYPKNKQITIIATGRYVGEGFDVPRLDTLFLAMPISWKGTLQQYAGRLHRLYENKKEVIIYDYIDIHVRMLEKMYYKRLSGYAAIGYKTKGGIFDKESINFIYDKTNFLPVYNNDIFNAKKEIVIVSPYITNKRTLNMLNNLRSAINNKVKIIIITRPEDNYKSKDLKSINETLYLLKETGIHVILRSNIHQKFAVIDKKTVWYGSINLLSFGNSEESMMRLECINIAAELINSIENNIRAVPKTSFSG